MRLIMNQANKVSNITICIALLFFGLNIAIQSVYGQNSDAYTINQDWSKITNDDRLFPPAVYSQMVSGRGYVSGDLIGGDFTGRKNVTREEIAKEALFRFKTLVTSMFGIELHQISEAIASGKVVPYLQDLRLIQEGFGKPGYDEIMADPFGRSLIEDLKQMGVIKPGQRLPSDAHLINIYHKHYNKRWNEEFGSFDDIGTIKTLADGKEITMDGDQLKFRYLLATNGGRLHKSLNIPDGKKISYKEVLGTLNAQQRDMLASRMENMEQVHSIASYFTVMRDDYNDLRTKKYIPFLATKSKGVISQEAVKNNLLAKNKKNIKQEQHESEYNINNIDSLFARTFIGEENLDKYDSILEAALAADRVTFKRDIRDSNYPSITLCNKSDQEMRIASIIEWKPRRWLIDKSIESKLLVNGWAYFKPGECKSVRTGLANAVFLCIEKKSKSTGIFELVLYYTEKKLDFDNIIKNEILGTEDLDYEACVNPFGDFHFEYDDFSDMTECGELHMNFPFLYFIQAGDIKLTYHLN